MRWRKIRPRRGIGIDPAQPAPQAGKGMLQPFFHRPPQKNVGVGSNCDTPAQMGDVCFTPDTGSDGPHRRCGHSIVKRKKLRRTDSGTFSETVVAISGWLSSTLLALARKLRRRFPKGGRRSMRMIALLLEKAVGQAVCCDSYRPHARSMTFRLRYRAQ